MEFDHMHETNLTELPTYVKSFELQRYRFNFLIGGAVPSKAMRTFFSNTFSALHSVPISHHYLLVSRLLPVINVTIYNDPVEGDSITHFPSEEFTNMEVFGVDFPILVAIVLAIMSSTHIIFYVTVTINITFADPHLNLTPSTIGERASHET